MKKYNVQNYIRYKEDLKASMPEGNWDFKDYTRNELIVKFMPLVENLARKFSTTQQASGVLSINDLIQIGGEALTKSVDKLLWEKLDESDDLEKTLKSFFSKRIKGAIRRRIDMHRGDISVLEAISPIVCTVQNHQVTAVRANAPAPIPAITCQEKNSK